MIDLRGISGLIFDCDGTLADTMPAHYESWCETLRPYGIPLDVDRFYSMGGWPSVKIISLLAAEAGVRLDIDAVARKKNELYLTHIPHARPIDPVVEFARDQHGRIPMAVATGSVRWVCIPVLQHLGIEHWFETVLCAEYVKRHKPEPDVFLEAARRIGVLP